MPTNNTRCAPDDLCSGRWVRHVAIFMLIIVERRLNTKLEHYFLPCAADATYLSLDCES